MIANYTERCLKGLFGSGFCMRNAIHRCVAALLRLDTARHDQCSAECQHPQCSIAARVCHAYERACSVHTGYGFFGTLRLVNDRMMQNNFDCLMSRCIAKKRERYLFEARDKTNRCKN